MRIDIVTIFPEIFPQVMDHSILKRAQENGLVSINVHNLRDYAYDKRKTVDDRPYGGGPGMVMKPEPIFDAVSKIESDAHGSAVDSSTKNCSIVLMSASGEKLSQDMAKGLSSLKHLVIICGHYEGVDERIIQSLAEKEISIGDYVLTGGELPAMVLIDCVARLIPGVIGHDEATLEESFSDGLLEYPHYTRPPDFKGMKVPDVLRCGNHQKVGLWRKLQSFSKTLKNRPDMIRGKHKSQLERI